MSSVIYPYTAYTKYPLPNNFQLQHAMEHLDIGNRFKQVETMTGISKNTLIRTRK